MSGPSNSGDDDGAPGTFDLDEVVPDEADGTLQEPDEIDPDEIGPSIDIPDPTDTDATLDPEIRRLFWKLVMTFNLALFALSLGPMLIFFRGEWIAGGTVFLIGAVAFGYGYIRYRRDRPGQNE